MALNIMKNIRKPMNERTKPFLPSIFGYSEIRNPTQLTRHNIDNIKNIKDKPVSFIQNIINAVMEIINKVVPNIHSVLYFITPIISPKLTLCQGGNYE